MAVAVPQIASANLFDLIFGGDRNPWRSTSLSGVNRVSWNVYRLRPFLGRLTGSPGESISISRFTPVSDRNANGLYHLRFQFTVPGNDQFPLLGGRRLTASCKLRDGNGIVVVTDCSFTDENGTPFPRVGATYVPTTPGATELQRLIPQGVSYVNTAELLDPTSAQRYVTDESRGRNPTVAAATEPFGEGSSSVGR